MSLDFKFDKVADYKNVCWEAEPMPGQPDRKRIAAVTERLIWATMGIGMGKITEENYEAFFKRLALYETLAMGWDRQDQTTLADVRKHIGLTTNACFKDEREASFRKRVVDSWEQSRLDWAKRAEATRGDAA